MIRFSWRRNGKERLSSSAKAIRQQLGTRSIVMIGLMGCGKSSVGRRLASRLHLPFVDADDEIELAAGQTIADIFADHGEEEFRNGERKVIARLLAGQSHVVATGGGAFMDAETRQTIVANGISVWLKADLPVLMQRVSRRTHRPLLQGPDPEGVMRDLIAHRYPVYGQSDVTIVSRDVPHDVVINDIIKALRKGPLSA